MREKCSNTKFFWSIIYRIRTEYEAAYLLDKFHEVISQAIIRKDQQEKKIMKVMKKDIRTSMEHLSASAAFFLL